MTDELVFESLDRVEKKVRIGDHNYYLREATGKAAQIFQDAQLRAMKFNAQGKSTGFDGLAQSELLLVSLCLFDDGDKPVPLEQIQNWPSRVTRVLYEQARLMSGLQEKKSAADLKKQIAELQEQLKVIEEDQVGNSSSDSTDGSS